MYIGLKKIVVRLFVDNVSLHKYWNCHRLPERSFFVEGRQFHVCARCTGLILGLPASICLLPIREVLPIVFAAVVIALALDGLTQLAQWRVSNNKLRFCTGFGTSATFLPTLLTIGGY